MASMVSYSTTTAIVYGVSGSIFFFLIFLLVLLGLEPALRSDNWKTVSNNLRVFETFVTFRFLTFLFVWVGILSCNIVLLCYCGIVIL